MVWTLEALLRSALWYNDFLGCNVVFERIVPSEKDPDKTVKMPVHGLRPCYEIGKDLYEEKMTKEDIVRLYSKIRSKKPSGIGLICNLSVENFLFLDFDNWQVISEDKEGLMRELAGEGILYETPRGFRLLILLDRGTRRLGDVRILYNGIEIGEGGGPRSMHKWTVPPSFVINANKYYKFVLSDGTRIKYPWEIRQFSTRLSTKDTLEYFEEFYSIRIVEENRTGTKRINRELKINGFNLNIDSLSNTQTTVLLYLTFEEAGCPGLRRIIESIAEQRVAPVRKEMYYEMDIPRTTRWLLQYIFTSILAVLGAGSGKAEEWLLSWRFIDEDADPRDDSPANAIYNVYSIGKLALVPRGSCPFCRLVGEGEGCSSSPIFKVLALGRKRIERIYSFVKTHAR